MPSATLLGCLAVTFLALSRLTSVSALNALTDEEIAIINATNITVTIHNNNSITLSHHGVPDHGWESGINPNDATTQNYNFNVPREATVVEDKGCVKLGAIGLSLSGATFYNPYTGFGYNAVEGDCNEDFDSCSGHASPDGAYHYHKLPACLYTGNDLRDKLLGVAFDGYPIYGPMDENGNNLTSADLDKCHGHTYKGRYIYRVTHDFPYVMACYHGETYVTTNAGPNGFGRRQRYAERVRRQMPPPGQGGGSTDSCMVAEFSDWQDNTCYAFCENPSTGEYDDNCPISMASSIKSSAFQILLVLITLSLVTI